MSSKTLKALLLLAQAEGIKIITISDFARFAQEIIPQIKHSKIANA